MGRIVSHICPRHGFQQGSVCSECTDMEESLDGTPAIHTDSWVEGYWEHIDTKPIYIRDKKHLFQECEKRGHLPRAFMKPKSQGPGYEFKRR